MLATKTRSHALIVGALGVAALAVTSCLALLPREDTPPAEAPIEEAPPSPPVTPNAPPVAVASSPRPSETPMPSTTPTSSLPPLDLDAPKVVQTATFALG